MHLSTHHGAVVAVCKNAGPGVPKLEVETIQLIEGYGVEGDYHAGALVRHRYLVRKDPTQPNHRHVLLVDTSILAELAGQGIHLSPGMMGENIVVEGIVVMGLALGTRLEIGVALLEVTEIRTPCAQLNAMHPDLLETVAAKEDGEVGPNAGVFARVLRGGPIQSGAPVTVQDAVDAPRP